MQQHQPCQPPAGRDRQPGRSSWRSRRRLLLALALCAACACLRGADAVKERDKSKGRWRQPPPEAPPPGAHLFHKDEDALAWDNDELMRIQNLHLREFDKIEEYLAAPNLAAYMGLHPIDALHMSVPLSIVFVGFKGDGNAKVKVSDDELMGWFRHIDHVLPHSRVALSELSCSEDGHCAGAAVVVQVPPSPLPSYVHLNLSVNVVSVAGGAVMEAFERAIAAFSRPVDPDLETGDQQVDALKLEAFVDSFVGALGLDASYTLVVLNPRWSPSLPSYAYRIGFSEPELRLLSEQAHLPELQPHSHAAHAWGVEPTPPSFATGNSHSWMSLRKFKVSDLEGQSHSWAIAAGQYLNQLEDYSRQVKKMIGPRTKGLAAVARAGMLLANGDSELRSLVHASLSLAPEHLHNPRFRATHPLEDCPTPLWVSKSRWLYLDLTARRTDWGPALGGDGVVHHNTLPDVTYAFGVTDDKRSQARQVKAEQPEEAALKQQLNAMRTQRLSAVANMQQHARMMQGHVVQGGAVTPDGQPGPHTQTPEEQAAQERRNQEMLLQAEMTVYEHFATQHCNGRINPPVACHDAEEAVADLKNQLRLLSRASGNKIAAHRDHAWDIFGIYEDDNAEVASAESAAKDVFFSDLSNVVSRGIRHVITPPTATWHHRGYIHDTASPFAHRVHFTIYTIRDTSRVLGPWRDRGVHFDQEAFKEQLARLAMPHQGFSFSQVTLNLMDDPMLASAFAVSLRTSFMQVPHAVSDPVENEALYLDSRELALRLRLRFDTGTRRATATDPHMVLEVPIFVFELDRDTPVLIDEHYNARALEDLVMVVQNAANQDEHPTGMMCDGILLQRPLSPLKHALSAVLEHLGGILPPHLGYNPARKLVQHDWLWSVGGHPLSWTSWGSKYSQLHIDALHRTYLLDAIDSSVDLVNDGILLLQDAAPHAKTFAQLTKMRGELKQLLQQFAQTVAVWRTMVDHAALLDYPRAAEVITTSEMLARAFVDQCRKVVFDLRPHKCKARSRGLPPLLVAAIYGTSVSAGLAVAFVLIWPLFKKKAKAM